MDNLDNKNEIEELVVIDEITEEREDTPGETEEGEFYPVPKGSTVIFSLLSLIFSLVALAVAIFLPYISLAVGIGAIIFSVLSQRLVGYFDKLAVGGLIIAIFATVFACFVTGIDHSGILEDLLMR